MIVTKRANLVHRRLDLASLAKETHIRRRCVNRRRFADLNASRRNRRADDALLHGHGDMAKSLTVAHVRVAQGLEECAVDFGNPRISNVSL